MYLRVCCRAFAASTAQRNQPCTKQHSQLCAVQTAAQASRQSWQEPARGRSFTARCVLKTNEEIKICPAYENTREVLTSSYRSSKVMREGFALFPFLLIVRYYTLQHYSFSPSFLFRGCMRRPGCFSCSMELLAFAGPQFAPKESWISLTASFTFCSIIPYARARRAAEAHLNISCMIIYGMCVCIWTDSASDGAFRQPRP